MESVAVAWNTIFEPSFVGVVPSLAVLSAGPAVIVGAELPTVTLVVTVSACTKILKLKSNTTKKTKSPREIYTKFLIFSVVIEINMCEQKCTIINNELQSSKYNNYHSANSPLTAVTVLVPVYTPGGIPKGISKPHQVFFVSGATEDVVLGTFNSYSVNTVVRDIPLA